MKRISNNPLKNPGKPDIRIFRFLIAMFIVGAGSAYLRGNKQTAILGGITGVSKVLIIYQLSVRDYKEWLFWERVDLRRARIEKNSETFEGPKTWHDWIGLKGSHRPPFNKSRKIRLGNE